MDELCRGLPLTAHPYAGLAQRLDRTESEVMQRIQDLHQAGILARLGVIVRHRALGWRANAMVVWDIEPDAITEAGPQLAAVPGVTLCYERRPVPGKWPYRLYNMIHARSRDEAMATLDAARALPVMAGIKHKVLFSTRCFKQTGAMIAAPRDEAAA
jgi:DNA-binding Lrp family transcriptional regulator